MNDRTKSGGASEVGALFGCHPFLSEYSLWALKTGLIQQQDDTERLNAGRFLEPAILAEFNRVSGLKFGHNQMKFYALGSKERISATPDGVHWEPELLVADVKTVMPFMAEAWSNGTPEYIQWQLKQQMLCTGAQKAVTIAMFGFSDPRHEWYEHNTEDDTRIVAAWDTFWKRVDGELPPPEVDGHRATTAAIAQVKPQASVVELSPEAYEWSRELALLEAKAKEPEARIAELKNKIRAALGTNSTGVFPDGSGWRLITINRKESVIKATTYTTMRRINGKEAIKESE